MTRCKDLGTWEGNLHWTTLSVPRPIDSPETRVCLSSNKISPAPSQCIGNCIVFHSKCSPTYKIDHLEIIRIRAIGFGGRWVEGISKVGGWVIDMDGSVGEMGGSVGEMGGCCGWGGWVEWGSILKRLTKASLITSIPFVDRLCNMVQIAVWL